MGYFRKNIEKAEGYTPGFQPTDRAAIKINTNENPYPPSPKVFEAIARLDDEALRRYPPVLWDEFREAAAKVHGVEPEMIMAGNGGDELLTILVRCCCDQNRPLAYPAPTYSLYPVLAAIQDAVQEAGQPEKLSKRPSLLGMNPKTVKDHYDKLIRLGINSDNINKNTSSG